MNNVARAQESTRTSGDSGQTGHWWGHQQPGRKYFLLQLKTILFAPSPPCPSTTAAVINISVCKYFSWMFHEPVTWPGNYSCSYQYICLVFIGTSAGCSSTQSPGPSTTAVVINIYVCRYVSWMFQHSVTWPIKYSYSCCSVNIIS